MGHSSGVWERAAVQMSKDRNNNHELTLRVPRGASARICLQGGQVISWKNERGEELLFTSSKAISKPLKSMRGIPICFPVFENCGNVEHHGFAKSRLWAIDKESPHLQDNNCGKFVDLILKSSEDYLKSWPHCLMLSLQGSAR